MPVQWKRVRPGLYHMLDGVRYLGLVERGAETGWWWWSVGTKGDAGRMPTLRQAKRDAEQRWRDLR